ncbi:MAG: ImmA/IrrE family metallo-endopeptidase [Aestuariivita sp.]|nr:ImmA/IrrE family metallo-endopeptidase [Aestuariivita sp.]MCY4347283.1 ImmA/IrrE family metallo-endopeptidase [Aestuariivita sp.]
MTIKVNPNILAWARETAGLSAAEAAIKLPFKTSKKSTAAAKLQAIESGEKSPTPSQLNHMANVYRRPLLTFYMKAPPRTGIRGTDFRQFPNNRAIRDNALLDALLRDVRTRQEMIRDMLVDENDFETLDFVGSIGMNQGVAHAVDSISRVLRFDPLLERRGNADRLFKQLRGAAETAGVFVLLMSNLGSHHSTISAEVFRGFTIADTVAPFVVINAKDARAARAFTLIHELAHIFLGQTGVSGSPSTGKPTTQHTRVEQFCNDIAGEFLLPRAKFLPHIEVIDSHDTDALCDTIKTIADQWSVSEPMVAYRLHRLNAINPNTYNILKMESDNRWHQKLAQDRESKRRGFSPIRVKQSYLGNALLGVVQRYVRDDTLSHTKAATLLGSRPCAVEPLLKSFESKQKSFVSKEV